MAPFSSAVTLVGPDVVISSSPSEPWTTQTRSAPRFFKTCASGSVQCFENTPIIWRRTPAGLDKGPSRLKIVRVPSSTRVAATFFIAGWCAGANIKPIPASRIHSSICSGDSSMFTPKAESTSAAPERDDNARLPCLATGTPAPATISAAQVEILNEPEASPPVPTTSIASGGACTRSIFARMTLTAPVISSTLSPRTRNAIRSPPICDGVASPDIICSKAVAASSRASAAPVATLAMSDLNSTVTARPSIDPRPRWASSGFTSAAPSARAIPRLRNVEEIFQEQMTVLRRDAFGMELHAMHRQPVMRKPHHQTVLGFRRHAEIARHGFALDHQRMIARRLEWRIDATKDAPAAVLDFRQLAMNRDRRAHHLAAERLADRLMPEADAEDRDSRRGGNDQIETDARLVRRARAWREHDGVRLGRDDIVRRHLVVAMHVNLGPELTEIMHEVEGETVVIVDQNDHGHTRIPAAVRHARAKGVKPRRLTLFHSAVAPDNFAIAIHFGNSLTRKSA